MQTLKQSTFIEQMVKRGTKEKDTRNRILILASGIIIAFVPFFIGANAVYYAEPVVLLVAAFAVWILWRRAAKEYEYIYTDGNLDFDVIYSRSSRKHLASFDTRSVKIIAPANDPKAKAMTETKPNVTLFACAGAINDSTYVLVGEYASKSYHVYFEPEARILRGIKSYAPRTSIIRPEDLIDKAPAPQETPGFEESDL